MRKKKKDTYAEHLGELANEGIRYVPFVLSCYGRLHPEAAVTLERLALQAARKQGVSNYLALRRRAAATLSVAIQRRAVAMAKACLPKLSEEALQFLLGEAAEAQDL